VHANFKNKGRACGKWLPMHKAKGTPRPLLLLAASFILGLVAATWIHQSDVVWLWMAMPICILIAIVTYHPRKFMGLLSVVVFLAGILNAVYFLTPRSPLLDTLTQTEDWVTVVGRINSYGQVKKNKSISYVMTLEGVRYRYRTEYLKQRVMVYCYGHPRVLPIGQRVRWSGRFLPIKRATNPGEFDYAAYLKQNNIHYILHVYGHKSERLLSARYKVTTQWIQGIQRIRAYVSKRIDRYVNPSQAAIMKAMVLGERDQLTSALWRKYNRAGISHILSISGLHLALLMGIVHIFFVLCRIPKSLRVWIIAFISIQYAMLAGLRIPVLRAAVMTTFYYFAVRSKKQYDGLNLLGFAALCILVTWPHQVFSVSFQLSFLAVLSILLISPALWNFFPSQWVEPKNMLAVALNAVYRYVIGSLCVSLAVLLGIWPCLAWHFHVYSPILLLSNVMVLPWVFFALALSFLTLPFFAGPAWVGSLIGKSLSGLYWLSDQIVGWVASIAVGTWHFPTIHWGYYLAYYGALFCALKLSADRQRKMLLLLLLLPGVMLATFQVHQCFNPRTEMIILNAASDVAILQYKNKNILINTGRQQKPDDVSWVVEPALKSLGINRLDTIIVLSKKKQDWSGLDTLINDFDVRHIFLPDSVKWEKSGRRRKPEVVRFNQDKAHLELNSKIKIFFDHSGDVIEFQMDGKQIYLLRSSNIVFDEIQMECGSVKDCIIWWGVGVEREALSSDRPDPDIKVVLSKKSIKGDHDQPWLEGTNIWELPRQGALYLGLQAGRQIRWNPARVSEFPKKN